MLFLAGLAVHCMHMIVETKDYLCEKKGVAFLSYSDVVRAPCQPDQPPPRSHTAVVGMFSLRRSCFLTCLPALPYHFSPQAYECMGRAGTYLVNFALLVTQFGFCCVYLLFIASHLAEVRVWPVACLIVAPWAMT